MTRSAESINIRADLARSGEEKSYWEGVQLANEAVLKTLIEQFARFASPDNEEDRIEIIKLLRRSAKDELSPNLSVYDASRSVEHKVAEATINSVFASINQKIEFD